MARIAHLISQLEVGGAQRQLSQLLSIPSGHQREVISLIASPEERLSPYFRDPGTGVHYLSYTNDFYDPDILPSLRRLLREREYAIVHCWLFESIIQGVLAARVEGIPCIASPRTILAGIAHVGHRMWEKRLMRQTIRMADLSIFPSHSTAVDFLDAGWVQSSRMRVVPNGVDCEHFQPIGGGSDVVAVGRISPEKNYEELARIIRRVRKQYPDLRCVVAGGGDPGNLEGLEFAGSVDDVREVLRNAAVYVSTSWIEGMSNALMEAQAMGIPAVIRHTGANSEVIQAGWNGFLARSEEEFVEKILLLLRSPDLRRQIGSNGRSRMVTRYSISACAQGIEAVYDELL